MAKKETPATTQAEYDKAWEEVKSGKQKAPSFDDMGPLNSNPRYQSYKKERDATDASVMQKALKNNPGKEAEITKLLKDKRASELSDIKANSTKFFDNRDARQRPPTKEELDNVDTGMKKGGAVKYKKGGSVSSASKRADGCATKGKTKGRII